MANSSKLNPDFVQCMESMGNLDALDKMTGDLTNELKDSQQVMNQIKGMIDSLPKNAQDLKPEPNYSGFRHEDISNFLNDPTPNLLMPDMVDNTYDVDLDVIIATMKSYAEGIINNVMIAAPDTKEGNMKKKLDDLDFEQYASSLDELCKRLSNMKMNNEFPHYSCSTSSSHRIDDLEAKVSVLCDDVNTFKQMMEAKTTHSETDKNWTPTQLQQNAHNYDQIMNKLLSGISEVSYLLYNKN